MGEDWDVASLLGLGTCPVPCCLPSVPGLAGSTLPCVNLGTCGGQRPHRDATEEPFALLGMLLNFFLFFSFHLNSVLAINPKIETILCRGGFHRSDDRSLPSSQHQCAALVL